MAAYRFDRTWRWNLEHGPQVREPFPRVPRTPWKRFLGIPVRSRFGISAGILLSSRWIEVYARLGFDLLTYKTVRSRPRPSYPLPNWVFIEERPPAEGRAPLRARSRPRRGARPATAAVSFGMPSIEPAAWMEDVRRARRSLPRGQALIVSVVASPAAASGREELVRDFAWLSERASGSGAQVVEANLSCPNVSSAEGSVYTDPGLARAVMREVKRAAGRAPVIAKAGHFEGKRPLRRFLNAVDGLADAVLILNAPSRRVLDPRGRPIFGRGREAAGVIGRGIGRLCFENVKAALEVVREDRLGLEILAGGGVLEVEDAGPYFTLGAHAVMLGGAPAYDPHLAVRFKEAHPEW